MKISELLLEKIKTDREFRFGVALALGISERQVTNLVKSKSENLTKYWAVEFYKAQGYSLEQIFEPEENPA